MEKFQPYLLQNKARKQSSSTNTCFYDFEKANFQDYKQADKGCDQILFLNESNSCKVILLECKGGHVSIHDFEDARKQLEYSVDVIVNMFGEPPDLAVLCHGKLAPMVAEILKNIKYIKHEVRFIAVRYKEHQYCRKCP